MLILRGTCVDFFLVCSVVCLYSLFVCISYIIYIRLIYISSIQLLTRNWEFSGNTFSGFPHILELKRCPKKYLNLVIFFKFQIMPECCIWILSHIVYPPLILRSYVDILLYKFIWYIIRKLVSIYSSKTRIINLNVDKSWKSPEKGSILDFHE